MLRTFHLIFCLFLLLNASKDCNLTLYMYEREIEINTARRIAMTWYHYKCTNLYHSLERMKRYIKCCFERRERELVFHRHIFKRSPLCKINERWKNEALLKFLFYLLKVFRTRFPPTCNNQKLEKGHIFIYTKH